jgi:hypothetical protein
MRMCKIYGEVELLAVAPTSSSPPVHPTVNTPLPSTTPTLSQGVFFTAVNSTGISEASTISVTAHLEKCTVAGFCVRVGVTCPVHCTLTYCNRNYFPDLS